MNGRHTVASTQTNEYPDLEDEHDEDPARFLESNTLMATARIAGIRDPELLAAYETVAKEITTGSYRTTILEAIAKRKVDLGIGDELTDTTSDPVAATDGGTVKDDSAIPADNADTTADSDAATSRSTESASVPNHELHPDTKGLEAGQVVVVEYDDRTEYIFPATVDADAPYLCRSFDAEGDERTDAPIGLTFEDVDRRTDRPNRIPIAEIDIQPPTDAATNGGDGQ